MIPGAWVPRFWLVLVQVLAQQLSSWAGVPALALAIRAFEQGQLGGWPRAGAEFVLVLAMIFWKSRGFSRRSELL